MAKIMIVGDTIRKSSFCPQCRKRISSVGRKKDGVKCPRCGFFKWEDYAKFPSFTAIPEPTKEEVKQTDEFIANLDTEEGAKVIEEKLGVKPKVKSKGSKRPVLFEEESGEEEDKGSLDSRPQLKRDADRGSGKNKPVGDKVSSKKLSGKGIESKDTKGKSATKK